MSSENFHTSSMLRTAYYLLKNCQKSVFWIGLTMVALPECVSVFTLSFQSVLVSSSLRNLVSQHSQPLHYEKLFEPISSFFTSVLLFHFIQAILLFMSYLALSHIAFRKARGLPIHIPMILKSIQRKPWSLIKAFLFVCIAKILELIFQIPFQVLSVMIAIGLTWSVVEPTPFPIRQLIHAITFQYSDNIHKFRVFMVHIVFGAFLFSGHTLLHHFIDGLMTADHWLDIPSQWWLLTLSQTDIPYIWCVTRLLQITVETTLFCYVPFFAIALLHKTLHNPLITEDIPT
ncbi:MAG: hypothetical protein AB8C84_06925 [Oligoflexales bacterium]